MKVVLIGGGILGKIHLKYLVDEKDIELIGVVDVSEDICKDIREQFKLRTFNDHRETISFCDCAIIVSTTETHFAIARDYLEQKKDVFIEKPICNNIKEAEILENLAAENGCIIQVGHIERYNPVISYIKDKISDIIYFRSQRYAPFSSSGRVKDVGIILDLMIHDIDLMHYLMGGDIASYNTSSFPVYSEKEDIAFCNVTFKDGKIADLSSSRINEDKKRAIDIIGKNFIFNLDLLDLTVKETYIDKEKRDHPVIIEKKFDRLDTILLEQRDFFKSVTDRSSPTITVSDGIRALRTALALTEKGL